ncbi:uncharacterized protein LOC120845340 [Ixodes scapularis]|uniref:uncharacterized protein LOC120845340 n=1 Tax=Ixodes scapularis TaxID=6945 RepID=UPI001A9D68E3|nr:uncharacterized protein LOC120845340 [Ixodes scapularis]
MDLHSLRKPELIRICEELGVDIRGLKRKPLIIKALLDFGTDEAELSECWEEVQRIDKEKRELDEQERSDRLKSQEAELKLQEAELQCQEQELEMKRLELELVKSRGDREGSPASSTEEGKSFKMKNLMQPFKIGEDVGLFLVNFERTCEKVGFARLTKDEAEDYEKVKTSLLRKYRLSAEAFRQRFRSAEKKPKESFPEFAYNLRANLAEWLKGVDAHGDHDKAVECIFLEQFLCRISEETRFWVQDKPDAKAVQRAAELAEEFATRRALDEKGHPRKEKAFPPGKRDDGRWPGGRFSRDGRPKRVEGENRKEPAQTKGEAGDGADGTVDHEKKKSRLRLAGP